MRGRSPSDVMRIGWRAPAGLLASLALHGLLLLGLTWSTSAPPVDFELTLPTNVEFGVVDAVAVEPPAPPPAPEPAAAPPAPADVVAAGPKPPKKPKQKPMPESDAGVDAGPEDAGAADAATPEPAPEPVASSDAGAPHGESTTPALAAFAPEGAQIALRLHLGALRESALAEDVRALLEAIPDWRLIVDGSGLDPLRDLERLFLATPNLSRSSLVVAGQYLGDETLPRKAVANLAAARGVKARWTRRGGMSIAPWPNADETARTVALIAPEQFVITRPEDLPRVLLVAKALAARAKAQRKDAKEVDPGAALLALGEGETLALSVEGARLFARGNLSGVPERLTTSVRALPEDGGFESVSTGSFDSPEQAEEAKAYWTRMRDRYASHPLVALVGMREPLVQMTLVTEGAELIVRTQVTLDQARVLLGFVRGALAPTEAAMPSAPPRSLPQPRQPTRPVSPAGP